MKDFYDIYYLSKTIDFDGAKLQSTISETLKRRDTLYNKDSFKRIVALAQNKDMQSRWSHFLKTINDDTLKFSVVIQTIQNFLEPIFDTIVRADKWKKVWNSTDSKWEEIKKNGQ